MITLSLKAKKLLILGLGAAELLYLIVIPGVLYLGPTIKTGTIVRNQVIGRDSYVLGDNGQELRISHYGVHCGTRGGAGCRDYSGQVGDNVTYMISFDGKRAIDFTDLFSYFLGGVGLTLVLVYLYRRIKAR